MRTPEVRESEFGRRFRSVGSVWNWRDKKRRCCASVCGARVPRLVEERAELPKMRVRNVGLLLQHRVGATARVGAAGTGEPGAVGVVVPVQPIHEDAEEEQGKGLPPSKPGHCVARVVVHDGKHLGAHEGAEAPITRLETETVISSN